MNATELRSKLEKAIERGIIVCKEIHSLRCPAVGYELVHGWCRYKLNRYLGEACPIGDTHSCLHRLDIQYSDRAAPTTLYVKYRTHPKIKEGYIDDENDHLCEVLEKIK